MQYIGCQRTYGAIGLASSRIGQHRLTPWNPMYNWQNQRAFTQPRHFRNFKSQHSMHFVSFIDVTNVTEIDYLWAKQRWTYYYRNMQGNCVQWLLYMIGRKNINIEMDLEQRIFEQRDHMTFRKRERAFSDHGRANLLTWELSNNSDGKDADSWTRAQL